MKELIKFFYILAGGLWALELLPQLWITYKRKTVDDIHICFPLICFTSFCIFFIASFLAKNWVLIFSHLAPFICNFIWLVLVLIYRRNKK